MFDFVLRLLLLIVIMIAININLITDNTVYNYIADIIGISASVVILTECIYSKHKLA